MDAKLVLDEKYYYLEVQHERIGKMIVGSSDHELSRIVNHQFKLSTKNCEAIKNGYDLDELAEKHYNVHIKKGHTEEDSLQRKIDFILGFVSALEILGDKKFSEHDMQKAFESGYETLDSDKTYNEHYEEMIQSLQQTEFDVEIEMECPECQSWGYISECRNNCNQKFLQPKLDANGCIILKRK